jgi:hypothetical protein
MYVFDVALDNATTFRVRAKRGGKYMTKYKAPMRVLYADTAVVRHVPTSVCLAHGSCLVMHEHCARQAAEPSRASPSSTRQ